MNNKAETNTTWFKPLNNSLSQVVFMFSFSALILTEMSQEKACDTL